MNTNKKPKTSKSDTVKKGIDREEQPAANSLTAKRINKLFRMFCVVKDDIDCPGCLLREIPWNDSKGQRSSLCKVR